MPQALTGVSVNGRRHSQFSYQSTGRVAESGLVGGVERSTFSYGFNSTTVTNARGARQVYTYAADSRGRRKVTRIVRSGVTDCPNAAASTEYDNNGFIDYELDWSGTRKIYSYNAKGQLTSLTTGINSAHPGKQRLTTYAWSSSTNRLLTVRTYGASTAEPLTQTSYSYTSATSPLPGRLASVTQYNRTANGVPGQLRRTRFTYTVHPNKMLHTLTIDGPRTDVSDVTVFEYNSLGFLVSVRDAAGHVTTYGNHNGLGLPGTVTDPNGLVTQLAYNQRGQLISRTVLAAPQRTTTFQYHPLGALSAEVRPDGSRLVSEYNDAGQRIGVHMNGYQAIKFSVNALGNITQQTHTNACPVGEICSKALSTSFVRHWEYDEIGRMTADEGHYVNASDPRRRTEYRYDNNGNVTEVRGHSSFPPIARTSTNAYGPHNELLRATNANGQTTEFEYDGGGRVRWVKDPKGAETTYLYDGFGNLVRESSADSGITTYEYDAAGNRLSLTRAQGTPEQVVVRYTYDALNRLLSAAFESRTDHYVYDICDNGKGRLCSAHNAYSADSYGYTPTGQLASQSSVINGTPYVTTRDYDALDRLTRITYPGGQQALYEYNNQDQVTAVKTVIGGSTQVLADAFSYKHFGPVTGYRFGNATQRSFDYDLNFRPVRNGPDLSYAQNIFDELAGTYDAAYAVFDERITEYGYDKASRLTSIRGPEGAQDFTLDGNGNRLTHNRAGAIDGYSIATGSNRLNAITGARARSYSYAANGNLKTESGWRGNHSYGYDPIYNRLSLFSRNGVITSYLANAFNQRVRKAGPGGNYNYLYAPDGTLLAETQAGSTAMSSAYIWLHGQPIAVIRNGITYYVFNDHLGRPREVQNASRSVVWKADTAAFDRSVSVNSFGGLNLGFPGQYYDNESGNWYNWNRYYDGTTGRYTQADPIGLAGGINRYAYVGGNPVSNTDPTGLVTWEGTGAFFSAIAGGGAAFGAFQLKSECVNGSQQLAQVYAAGPAVGFGLQLTGSGSTFNFEDGRSIPDATVFNGQFLMAWAGGAAGLGYGVSSIRLGEATTPFSHGYSAGVDMSVGGTAGHSWLGFSIPLSCGCDSGSGK